LPTAGATEIASQIQRAPLPNFDDTVIKRLKTNEPELVWNLMLRQAAAYYYARWPDIEDAGIYRIIGQKMMLEYPAIRQEGSNSWVNINIYSFNCLSKYLSGRSRICRGWFVTFLSLTSYL